MEVSPLPQPSSFVFKDLPTPTGPSAGAPLDLTASDGTGLELVSITARIVVEDPLAFTELHLVFQNPENRQLEGRFRIGLPSGASVSRFAMRIGGSWQEGEVVERQAARRAYEDFLHRRQDPALLEHEAGNEFSARVFPIEARDRKEIIVSYSHELTGADAAYRLPLIGLPRLGGLEIRALVGRSSGGGLVSSLGGSATRWEVLEVRKQGWKPDVDFVVQPPASQRDGLRHGNLAVVRVAPKLPTAEEAIGSMLIMVDTSASRALGHKRQLELVQQLVAGLAAGKGPDTPVALACFDQQVDLLFEGTAGELREEVIRRATDRMALGASDLEQALRWVASREGTRYERLLLLTDGVATAGETASEKLVETARTLGGAGVARLDVLAVGGLRDDAALKRLVTAGLAKDGTVCDGEMPLPEIAAKLTRATRSGLKIEVPGASWVWPSRLDGVQPGESTLIYVDLPEHRPVKVLIDGKPVSEGDLNLEPAERPLLERAWVKARIEKLEDQRARMEGDQDLREGLKKQILELSTKFRVLSPYTALLVLETEADYARFNIDRRSLADILTVGAGGLEVLHRTSLSVPPPLPAQSRGGTPEKAKKREAPGERRREVADDDALMADFGGDAEHAEGGAAETTLSGAPAPFLDEVMAPPPAPSAGPEPDSYMAEPIEAPSLSATAPSPRMAPSPAPAARTAAGRMQAAMASSPVEEEERPSLLQRVARAASRLFSSDDEAEREEAAPAERPATARPGLGGAPQPTVVPVVEVPATQAAAAAEGETSRIVAPEPPRPEPTPEPPRPDPVSAPRPEPPREQPRQVIPPLPQAHTTAWNGPFAEVMALVLAGQGKAALEHAIAWRDRAPGDVLALVALGNAAEAVGDLALAARAFGSLIDLFPSRADLRRFAGQLLERLAKSLGLDLAIDTYKKAVEQRPDHPAGHHLLGMALLKRGRFEEAFEVVSAGAARKYDPRFRAVDRILEEDIALVGAAWSRSEPEKRSRVLDRLWHTAGSTESEPSLRFILVWETDANDVDFHIHDGKGGHAYFREMVLPSGGQLYADITQGYGPECFTIRNPPEKRAYPYRLQAHYYRRGPMGYGMGKLQIIEHDGKGGFGFEERTYVVMEDGAYLELGSIDKPLPVS